jgi:hypothetical protein
MKQTLGPELLLFFSAEKTATASKLQVFFKLPGSLESTNTEPFAACFTSASRLQALPHPTVDGSYLPPSIST